MPFLLKLALSLKHVYTALSYSVAIVAVAATAVEHLHRKIKQQRAGALKP